LERRLKGRQTNVFFIDRNRKEDRSQKRLGRKVKGCVRGRGEGEEGEII
jgi:hypothetical protein